MKHTLLLLPCLLAGSLCMAEAATLTPSQALERVGDRGLRSSSTSSAPVLVSTALYKGTPTYYVFSHDGQTLFVGADEVATPLLGYTTTPASRLAEMPPQLRWWLDGMSKSIADASAAVTDGAATLRAPARRTATMVRESIAPMVTTTWNQEAPFNDLCPEIDGQHAVTGCVATAMAQVMNYFQWPATGQGSLTYSTGGSLLSLDFATVTFDWGAMLDSYPSATSGTEAERSAVATLMKACGYSVEMSYGVDESGATVRSLPEALLTYFDYDEGIQMAYRAYYTDQEWEEMIYDNLASVGPVCYGGVADIGGHEFVCDGYATDGTFHINWGWGGLCDGYFALSALDPAVQGIGGADGGFNSQQDAVLGICRPTGKSQASLPYIALQGTLQGEVADGLVVLSGGNNGGFINMGISTGTFTLGILLENGDATEQTVLEGVSAELAPLRGYTAIEAPLEMALEPGEYVARPVYSVDGSDWTAVKIPTDHASDWRFTVNDNGQATAFGEIGADNTDSAATLYDINGRRVDVATAVPGFYLQRTRTGVQKIALSHP